MSLLYILLLIFSCFIFFKNQGQKKRVAEEEVAARKKGLGIRLLPASEEDIKASKRVKFSSNFNKNRDEKRALIKSMSIFSESSSSSSSRRMELEAKRRRINATSASKLLTGGFKPSSWTRNAGSSIRKNRS